MADNERKWVVWQRYSDGWKVVRTGLLKWEAEQIKKAKERNGNRVRITKDK